MLFPSTSILETSLLADEADIGRKMLETIVKFDLTDLRFQSRFTTIDQLTQDALLRLVGARRLTQPASPASHDHNFQSIRQ
ncbi:hypothetical protein T4D_3030 [Trichinella pseudospiralis]|uniref:Uncharacterized protein n=1 Tax=Trichinella pseudospiralis TaxID=6337 RepID=A0A0V1FLW3_TRIPS|nr:hypothetical protein T4D_3030 [Trichinella pseudospiralis]